ncbi:cysteine peptidase family C39 domain-containing protein [Algoriphagus boritolerans]|uniref:cysteine peptidase family C39 domain-containing protein n=1 Tax=Algoriphagus boritolerans TaxID=308111 RepID=UPI0029374A46|nr:cysteine peptidase family C39 domain-containing protein [Algoriphagus boritolerans]
MNRCFLGQKNIFFKFYFSQFVDKSNFDKNFSHYTQPDSKDCGRTCLWLISKDYGKLISLKEIRDISERTWEGRSLLKLSDAAEAMGFKTICAKLSFENFIKSTSA